MDHSKVDVLAHVDLHQRVLEGLHRSGHVALDDEGELLHLSLLQGLQEVLERTLDTALRQLSVPLPGLPRLRDVAGRSVLFHNQERVTCAGHRRQAENLDGRGGPGFLDGIAGIVQHGANATERVSGHDGVSLTQSSALDQDGGHRTTAAVQVRFDRHTLGVLMGVRLQLQRRVGGQQHRFKERFHAHPLQRGDIHEHRVAAKILGNKPVLGQLAAHLRGVSAFLVDLVHSHHDRHLRRLGVIQRLDGLRLDSVIRSHNQDRDVGHLGTTRTHSREGFVTRCVDDRQRAVAGGDRDGSRRSR